MGGKRKPFSLKELKKRVEDKKGIDSGDQSLSLDFLAEHQQKIGSIKQLINPPDPGEVVFLFTDKSFNAFTFVPYLLSLHQSIDELHLSTYSINKRILTSFINLVQEGRIHQISMLVADSLKHQRPLVADQLMAFTAQMDNLKVRFAWNHSKIMLARCGHNHYVVEGSGNWSENSRHEQYVFANNESLYTFRKQCLNGA